MTRLTTSPSIAGLCVALLFWALPSQAQAPRSAEEVLQRFKAIGLSFRTGDVPVYFSACCEAEASEAQHALDGSRRFYSQKLGVRVDITAVLLTQEDFDRVTAPKQLPFRVGFVTDQPPFFAVIPLGEQSIVNQLYLPRQDRATPATNKLLAAAEMSYAEAVKKFMIHLVLHEIGHIQVRESGIAIANRWFDEFLSNYFSYTYLRAEQPNLATVVEALNLIPLGPVPHSSLEEYERLTTDPKAPTSPTNIGLDNYVWYQQQFERRAISVHNACGGVDFLTKVKAAFPNSGGAPTAKVAPSAFLARLERLCPGFQAWASALRNTPKQ